MLSILSINILDYEKKKSYKIEVTPKYCRQFYFEPFKSL